MSHRQDRLSISEERTVHQRLTHAESMLLNMSGVHGTTSLSRSTVVYRVRPYVSAARFLH